MAERDQAFQLAPHDHVFLGSDHARAERQTWAVIILCSAMMIAEIVGGALFGSLALIADGLHMSTHAGALLLAALAYAYARKYAHDRSFTFGTGKFGDLAGYTSAIVLALIALLIAYEAAERFLNPVPIAFREAIPIAFIGLAVNIASAWLLSAGHDHDDAHGHGHARGHSEEPRRLNVGGHALEIEVFENNLPPRFRVRAGGALPDPADFSIETVRPDASRQRFAFAQRDGYLESRDEIPEPHAFVARVRLLQAGEPHVHELEFEEYDHDAAHHRDNNMRAAIVHVLADAAVSVLVIIGLLLAWSFGWSFMDPLAGLIGALVIANWSFRLIRDTGAILLDRMPDSTIADKVRQAVESEGDRVTDLHLWRLGPGHLSAIVSVATAKDRDADHYRQRLARFSDLSHLTVEVQHAPSRGA